jgi:CubicO group peptidase (beta-lactamase class C family)
MKKIAKILTITLVILLTLIAIVYLSPYRYLLRGVSLTYLQGRNSAYLYDKKDFYLRKVSIKSGAEAYPLSKANGYNKTSLSPRLSDMLKQTGSASFMVLKNDSIIAEQYFGQHTDTTCSNAFSMTKSIVTMLVQLAIQEGKIKSWDDKVKTYLPWISGPFAEELTLRHLSTMTSGIDWVESYKDPFAITAKAYYGNDIETLMKTVQVIKKPGETYKYQSGATQFLSMVLKKATGVSPSVYATEKLWSRLGAEHAAFWHLDAENGNELTYCCFNAITRDFARLGIMLRHNGLGILDSNFLIEATKPFKAEHYGHSFWLGNAAGVPYFFMHGMKGQYVAIVPSHNLVVVRTGDGEAKGNGPIPNCITTYVEEAIKMSKP